MTTNTWQVHDLLEKHVHFVTVVHLPHVKLIVRAQAMTDAKATLPQALLHAANLLPAVWVPTQEVRELRALTAQRDKMRRLSTTAKNRLQNVLHRHHIVPPKGHLFAAKNAGFWDNLDLSPAERCVMRSDLATLAFAESQKTMLEEELSVLAAQDQRVPLLVQLPGIGLLTAMNILGASGEIERFPSAQKLVGYAGLYCRYHKSGERFTSGRLVNKGRRDLRWALVEAAICAVRYHPHWKQVYQEMLPRKGRNKTLVAVARKLLIAVWHVLAEQQADRYTVPEKVAATLFAHAYRVVVKNLPDGMSALQFTRHNLDRLGIGKNLTRLKWGSKTFKLPPTQISK
jgi:transposase